MGEKRKQTRAADLVGTVYKGFKVLDCKTENRRSFLQVECPYCKKIKWIRKDRLDDPHRKGCGCLMTKTQFKQKDLVGKRFGRLEVVKATSERDPHNGSVIWLCRCDCGNISECKEKYQKTEKRKRVGKINHLTHSFTSLRIIKCFAFTKKTIVSIRGRRDRWRHHIDKHPCRATCLYSTPVKIKCQECISNNVSGRVFRFSKSSKIIHKLSIIIFLNFYKQG